MSLFAYIPANIIKQLVRRTNQLHMKQLKTTLPDNSDSEPEEEDEEVGGIDFVALYAFSVSVMSVHRTIMSCACRLMAGFCENCADPSGLDVA